MAAKQTAKRQDGTSVVDLVTGAVPATLRAVKSIANGNVTLTANDNGALCLFDLAAGGTYTLPTAQVGLWFDFVVDTTVTSNSAKVITASAAEFIKGGFHQIPDAAAQIVSQAANGTTHRSWNGNGGTTGGFQGDKFRLTAKSATVWEIEGRGLATGTEATPFATS